MSVLWYVPGRTVLPVYVLWSSTVLLLAACAPATPAAPAALPGWRMLAQAPRPDAPVRFTVGLALSGAARLEKQLLEASDPWDPNYGRYLSMQQAHALTPLRVPDVPLANHVGRVISLLAQQLRQRLHVGGQPRHRAG